MTRGSTTERAGWVTRPRVGWAIVLLLTVVAGWLSSTRLHMSPDLADLFPDEGAAAALARFARAFGGGDAGAVLVRGGAADEVARAADDVAAALARRPSVLRVLARVPDLRDGARSDPTLAWVYAGPRARAALAAAVSDAGMRARIAETRAMLLMPGSEALAEVIARDPLRLAPIPWESTREIAPGARGAAGDPFVADGGRVRLVLAQARGSAFASASASAFVADAEAAIGEATAHHPGVRFDLAGGHAVARATEALIRRDLYLTAVLATVLAACMFLVTFRRVRALIAVMPPLALGTLWTLGGATLLPGGISAIAMAFASVVVGVGVDTGVHAYAAVMVARRSGLVGAAAAEAARRAIVRPTLIAAVAAGLAFGALALSRVAALRQLGLLCGAGEVLTAMAILAVTPDLAAWLERAPPAPARPFALTGVVSTLVATRARAWAVLGACAAIVLLALAVGWPPAGRAVVAVRPRGLAALATQDAIQSLFGGGVAPTAGGEDAPVGQWIVLSADGDPERARARADAIAEALEPLAVDGALAGYDALASTLPARDTVRRRLAARDALDLPARRAALSAALVTEGFDLAAMAPALDAFAHPAPAPDASAPSDETGATNPSARDAVAFLSARHVLADEGGTLAVTYVRARGDAAADARVLAAIRAADAEAIVTGFAHLEGALKEALARDLPRVTLIALVAVALALRAAFGRLRDGALVLFAVAVELGALGLAMRAFGIAWHVYDALVLPVLVGITLDEAMFLLHAARASEDARERAGDGKETPDAASATRHALDAQGPLVSATALTTAAGFGALFACSFDGLRDMGKVGVLGVLFGLLAALVVVPAGLRVLSLRAPRTRASLGGP